MSLFFTLPHRRSYAWKLARQVAKECLSFGTDQIMPLLIAVISAWAALHFKLVPFDETRAAYIAYLLPFAAASATYLIYQIARAPFVIHHEQEQEIERLRAEQRERATREGSVLMRFLNDAPQLRSEEHSARATEELAREMRRQQLPDVLVAVIEGATRALEGRLRIDLALEIVNQGAETSLHDWRFTVRTADETHDTIINEALLTEAVPPASLIRLKDRRCVNLASYHSRLDRGRRVFGWITCEIALPRPQAAQVEVTVRVLDHLENTVRVAGAPITFRQQSPNV